MSFLSRDVADNHSQGWRVCCWSLFALLSGCAHQPDLPSEALASADTLEHSKSLLATRQDSWPQSSWWQRYHDNQLDQLIREALHHAPSLAIAQARLRSAEGMARQAGASEMPQLSVSGDVTRQRVSYNYSSLPPHGWNTFGSGMANFSYEFDFWGKNRATVEAARSTLAASEAEQADAERVLVSALMQSYVELARLYANRDTAAEALKIRSETVSLFQQRYNNGLETLGSVRQVESLKASAEQELLGVEETIVLQSHAIAALLGKGPDRGLTLQRPTLAMTSVFGLPDSAGIDLLGHRPDVTAARWRVEAAAQQVGVAETLFYPNVSLSAFFGNQSMGLDKLLESGSQTAGVGGALYLPIFTGGKLEGQLDSARGRYQEAVAQYNQTLTQAMQQVADAVTSQDALKARLIQSRTAVDAAEDAYRIANNRYKGGLSTYLDVLSAEAALLQSRQVLVNMQARALSIDVSLVHALGAGYSVAHS